MIPELHSESCRLNPPELLVVIPIYNEQNAIQKVIYDWMDELAAWCEDFAMLAIDDGSSDRSLDTLHRLQERFGSRLLVRSRPNCGHGQTCLEGYRSGSKMGAQYVLQIDSDGQCDPCYFYRLWSIRKQFTVIYGVRTTRHDGWTRIVISKILRLMLLLVFRVNCPDANVPYRLMKTDAIMWAVDRIPRDFHLANVALAVLLARDKSCSHGFVPIDFRERYGGESKAKLLLFGRKAVELYRNMRKMFKEQETPVK